MELSLVLRCRLCMIWECGKPEPSLLDLLPLSGLLTHLTGRSKPSHGCTSEVLMQCHGTCTVLLHQGLEELHLCIF